MSSSFFHVFHTTSGTQSHSIKREFGNIEWILKLAWHEGFAMISGNPNKDIICALVPWTVTFDVTFKFAGIRFEGIEPKDFVFKKDSVITSEISCYVAMETLPNQKVEKVTVEISNIRAEGFHKFKMKNFESPNLKEDLTLNVNGQKLHCHSQILSWNSKIFRTMIEESEVPFEICLKETIPVGDLRELLHYFYFPFEPVNEHNFRQLLHWGSKFEVNHIVQLCEQFMKSQLLSTSITDESKLEIFLLSWKYSIESLNKIYVSKVVPAQCAGWMKGIVRSELYQDLDNVLKSKMWELLVENSYH